VTVPVNVIVPVAAVPPASSASTPTQSSPLGSAARYADTIDASTEFGPA
jgi:hypothetical protein